MRLGKPLTERPKVDRACPVCGTRESEKKWETLFACSRACTDEMYYGNRRNPGLEWDHLGMGTRYALEQNGGVDHRGSVILIFRGCLYRAANEQSGGMRGYGGRPWNIKVTAGPLAGREFVSTNLWDDGTIPPAHRPFLPDNCIITQVPYEEWEPISGLPQYRQKI